MADLQNSETELSAISVEDFPSASKDELLKWQVILVGIALLVMLACTAILRIGSAV